MMKEQKNFLRYKKDLFNRIKRKMPFGTPLFLIESGVFFENIHSHLPNNQIRESVTSSLIPPENHRGLVKKKLAFKEEEKAPKEDDYEDKQLNATMIASFGKPKPRPAGTDIRQAIFGKLGRSLSLDLKHKQKASVNPQKDASRESIPKDLVKTLQFDENSKEEGHFDLTESALAQFENLSDGYASGKETDAASIEMFGERPWMQRRKNRSRNRRRANRMRQSILHS